VRLQPPKASDLVRLMNHESAQRGSTAQHIISLYWGVAPAAIDGVLDQIRTALTKLVAEIRAEMPTGQDLPTEEQADRAVTFIITGERTQVHYSTAHATGEGATATSNQASGDGATATSSVSTGGADAGRWPRWRRIGAFIVGSATFAGAVVGIVVAFH